MESNSTNNHNANRIKLNVLGVTFSQAQQGAYALILTEEGGTRRVPVVIGAPEAQAIAIKIQNITTPRPLLHDLMNTIWHGFGIRLDEVFIYDFRDGIFMAELHMSNDETSIAVDARTSDAVAMAIRVNAPIYTTPEVMERTAFDSGKKNKLQGEEYKHVEHNTTVPLERMTVEQLQKLMAQCVAREDYERAADIRNVISSKQSDTE